MIPSKRPQKKQTVARMNATLPSSNCTIPADPNVIGVGVRQGYYFQTIAFVLLKVPDLRALNVLTQSNIFGLCFIGVVAKWSIITQLPPDSFLYLRSRYVSNPALFISHYWTIERYRRRFSSFFFY